MILRCLLMHIDLIHNVTLKNVLNLVDTDRLFICDKHMQRLIFYSGHPWEDWEQDHLDKFKQFLQ